MIYIEGELRNILTKICDHNWSLCETEDGKCVCFSENSGSFGNPNDTLLELLLASKFPVYLRVDSYNEQNTEICLCKDPSTIQFVYDPELYIAFYDKSGNIHRVTGIAICLYLKENPPGILTLNRKGIGIPSLGKFIIEQYMNTHETVDKKFVQAIINWIA